MSEVAESLKTLSISRKSSKDMLSSLSSEVENTWQMRCWKGFACQHRNGSGPGWAAPGRLPRGRHRPQAGANPVRSSRYPALPPVRRTRRDRPCPVPPRDSSPAQQGSPGSSAARRGQGSCLLARRTCGKQTASPGDCRSSTSRAEPRQHEGHGRETGPCPNTPRPGERQRAPRPGTVPAARARSGSGSWEPGRCGRSPSPPSAAAR